MNYYYFCQYQNTKHMPKIFPIKHAIPYFSERERERESVCVCVCCQNPTAV